MSGKAQRLKIRLAYYCTGKRPATGESQLTEHMCPGQNTRWLITDMFISMLKVSVSQHLSQVFWLFQQQYIQWNLHYDHLSTTATSPQPLLFLVAAGRSYIRSYLNLSTTFTSPQPLLFLVAAGRSYIRSYLNLSTTFTSPQPLLFLVAAGRSYIRSYLNLSTTATYPRRQRSVKLVPNNLSTTAD